MSLTVSALGTPRAERHNDGTMLISPEIPYPYQGTIRAVSGAMLKGVGRPPLCIDGQTETPTFCTEAAFGHSIHQNDQLTMHVLSDMPSTSRANINLQAVLFSTAHPAEVLLKDNARLANKHPHDYCSASDLRKVRAGLPYGLVVDPMAPWREVSSIPRPGMRVPVIASSRISLHKVAFIGATFDDMVEQSPAGTMPATISILRDPALPNATSIRDFPVTDIEVEWATSIRHKLGHAIVVNPRNPTWLSMAGDFDGDCAVVFFRDFDLHPPIPQAFCLKTPKPMPMLLDSAKKPSIPLTILSMNNGFASKLGSVVIIAQRWAERGMLDDESRVLTSGLAQACVSAQKHSMDIAKGMTLYGSLQTLNELYEPPEGFITDAIRKVGKATGLNAKIAAWAILMDDLPSFDTGLPVVAALTTRVTILNSLFMSMELLRGSRATIPDNLRNAAKATLLASVTGADETAVVTTFTKTYQRLAREISKLEDDDERRARTAELTELKAGLQVKLMQGEVSEVALIAYAPHRYAATTVSADAFESLKQEQTDLITVGYHELPDGVYPAAQLVANLIPSQRKNAQALIDLPSETPITLVELSRKKVSQIHLCW